MATHIGLDASIRSIVREVVREEIRAALDERGRLGARNVSQGSAADQSYVSIARAAQLAAVAPGTLRRWLKEGRLPTHRAGRVYRIATADLETFLRSGRSSLVAEKAREILNRQH